MKYWINEVFSSFQGEGINSGLPCVFIRFAGCNIKCPFCDTDHSKKMILSEGELFKMALELCLDVGATMVVLTGGEPLLNDLIPLVKEFRNVDIDIAIETNGTIKPPAYINEECHITVSPKENTQLKVSRATELKLINFNLSVDKAIEYSRSVLALHHFVNPVDIDGVMNFAETVQLVKELNKRDQKHQWRVGVQLHKIYREQ